MSSKLELLLAQHLRDVTFTPGLHHIEVKHAYFCGIFAGRSCSCDPEIRSGPLVDTKYATESPEEDAP